MPQEKSTVLLWWGELLWHLAPLQLSLASPSLPSLQAPQYHLLLQQHHPRTLWLCQDLQVPPEAEFSSYWPKWASKDFQEAKKSGECEIQFLELDSRHCKSWSGHDLWWRLPDCLSPPHLLRAPSSLYHWDWGTQKGHSKLLQIKNQNFQKTR